MALIYKITNKKNQKIYIGKTIRSANVRFQEHLQEAKNGKSLSKFHLALLKEGKDNFEIEILENNIPTNILDEKEQYYINLYNSTNSDIGYNVSLGGNGGFTYSKLSKEEVKEIIKLLLDNNNFDSFQEIGLKYNVSKQTIQSINNGNSWYQVDLDYPIRKYDTNGITISKEKYQNIVIDLQSSNLLLKDIIKKYNITEGQMIAINQGHYCYNGQHDFYKGIYSGPFPIRITNKQKMISKDLFLEILQEYLFSSKSLLSITQKYNINNSSIIYIMQGKRRKELTEDFILPIQKNKKQNQNIFIQKYPNLIKRKEE